MKPFVWVANAARRTVLGVRATWAAPEDAWAERWLSGGERDLYLAMDPRDRHHAVEIARAVLRRRPDAPPRLVRAALLHDVGKARRPYGLAERIAVHLWPAPAPPRAPLRAGMRGAWQVRAHHPHYGAEMIRRAGGDARVAELVERHHAPGGDEEAALLHALDERT